MFPRVADYFERGELGPSWPDLASFIERLQGLTALSIDGPIYPCDAEHRRLAAGATMRAAREVYDHNLDLSNPDPTALHTFFVRHLIDPSLRPFFKKGELNTTNPSAYVRALDKTRLPNAPLLYFALGCFYGEWLTKHTLCHFATEAPVQPMQDCFDATETGQVVLLYPFSHVTKALRDPQGDGIWCKADFEQDRVRLLLPSTYVEVDEDGRITERAADGSEAQEFHGSLPLFRDDEQALERLPRWLEERPHDTLLRELAMEAAFRVGDLATAEALADDLVRLEPKPLHLLRRVDLRWRRNNAASDDLLEDLDAALKLEPRFARARLRRADVLANLGRVDEAVIELEVVLDRCREPTTRKLAQELLDEIEE